MPVPSLTGSHVRDGHGRVFSCLRLVGRGSQGEVYECREAGGERRAALKVYTRVTELTRARERVLGLLALRLSGRHPVLAAPESELRSAALIGHFAPWSEGQPLSRWYARPPWSLAEALVIAAALARGVAELEGLGVAHGDLQPGNVQLARVGRHWEPELIDFDNAALPRAPPAELVPPHLYQAPEVIEGASSGVHSDRWSLAVLVHELTLLKRPFAAVEAAPRAYVDAVRRGDWSADPERRHPGTPAVGRDAAALGSELCTLFRQALSGEAAGRPPAADWAERLRHAAGSVWRCDRCGRELVLSGRRRCPSGTHWAVSGVSSGRPAGSRKRTWFAPTA